MPETMPPEDPRRSRYLLLMLMLMPIGVVLLATLVFYTRLGMPDGTRNRGTLISPPLQLNDMSLTDSEGKKTLIEGVKQSLWTFMVAAPAICDDICRKHFWEIRQTRIALGKYQGHIQRVWLVTGGDIDEQTRQWLFEEHRDMLILKVPEPEWKALLRRSPDALTSDGKAVFYLVDPRGFMMMYYSPANNYKDVITDMKFLLKGVE